MNIMDPMDVVGVVVFFLNCLLNPEQKLPIDLLTYKKEIKLIENGVVRC